MKPHKRKIPEPRLIAGRHNIREMNTSAFVDDESLWRILEAIGAIKDAVKLVAHLVYRWQLKRAREPVHHRVAAGPVTWHFTVPPIPPEGITHVKAANNDVR